MIQEQSTQTIEGRQAIKEALLAGHPIDKLYVLRGGEGLGSIKAKAKEVGIVVVDCDRQRLDLLSQTGAHQGVIALAAAHDYATLDDIWQKAGDAPPLIVVCDGLEDPRNLGAVIRTAEAAGAHGVVIPKRRSAGLSATCGKAAAGALEHLPVVRVPNLPSFLEECKKRGLWIYGAESGSGSRSVYDVDLSGGVVLVLGSEGTGLGQLVAKHCDVLVHIPLFGHTPSLNVSAAAAVLLFEVARKR